MKAYLATIFCLLVITLIYSQNARRQYKSVIYTIKSNFSALRIMSAKYEKSDLDAPETSPLFELISNTPV